MGDTDSIGAGDTAKSNDANGPFWDGMGLDHLVSLMGQWIE